MYSACSHLLCAHFPSRSAFQISVLPFNHHLRDLAMPEPGQENSSSLQAGGLVTSSAAKNPGPAARRVIYFGLFSLIAIQLAKLAFDRLAVSPMSI